MSIRTQLSDVEIKTSAEIPEKEQHLESFELSCANCKEMFASQQQKDDHCKNCKCVPSCEEESGAQSRDNLTSAADLTSESSAEIVDNAPFLCAACDKYFADYDKLTSHQCINSEKQILACDTCGKSFRSRFHLISHIQIHLKTRIACEICNKSFCNRNYLKIHQRTHTGTKPYGCDQCGKSFSQRGTLIRHMHVHSNKKPFTCRSCYRYFLDRNSYISHLQAHLVTK